MLELIERMLDRILGPRVWSVIREPLDSGGVYIYAIPTSRLIAADEVMGRDLRLNPALRLVAALRTTEQHSPEERA